MKAYLDTVIVSGMARGDLHPAAEMNAFRKIMAASIHGRLEIACDLVTSRETWREQDKTIDQALRLQFEQDRPKVPLVPTDHQLIGFRRHQKMSLIALPPLV